MHSSSALSLAFYPRPSFLTPVTYPSSQPPFHLLSLISFTASFPSYPLLCFSPHISLYPAYYPTFFLLLLLHVFSSLLTLTSWLFHPSHPRPLSLSFSLCASLLTFPCIQPVIQHSLLSPSHPLLLAFPSKPFLLHISSSHSFTLSSSLIPLPSPPSPQPVQLSIPLSVTLLRPLLLALLTRPTSQAFPSLHHHPPRCLPPARCE